MIEKFLQLYEVLLESIKYSAVALQPSLFAAYVTTYIATM